MPISVVCETCGTKLKAPDTAAGKRVKCPKCANLIPVPLAGGAAPASVSAAPKPKPKPEPKQEELDQLDELDELPEAGNEPPPEDELDDEDDGRGGRRKKDKRGARGPVSADDKLWGLLAHLAGAFFSWLGALIVFLIKKDQSPFLKHHTKESLNFQLTLLPIWLLVGLSSCCVPCAGAFNELVYWALEALSGLAYFALFVGNLIFCILAALAANKGEWYKYPFSFRMIK